MKTLYVAKHGQAFSAWWDDCPPLVPSGAQRRVPFRAPDYWHAHAIGTAEQVVADFVRAKIIKCPNAKGETIAPSSPALGSVTLGLAGDLKCEPTFHVAACSQEWAAWGVASAEIDRANKRKPKKEGTT